MTNCPNCNSEARYIQENNAWYCDACKNYLPTAPQPAQQQQPVPPPPPGQTGQAPGGGTLAQQLFVGNRFTIKQKKLSIAHKYFVTNETDALVAFVQQKMMKMKEDIRIYTDESKTTEIMRIQQVNILDFSGSFQVIDSQSNQVIGILKRKGLMSLFKDEWKILDPQQQEIGLIQEDGGLMWYLRRFVLKFLPMKYFIKMQGQTVGMITEKFEVIGDTYFVDLSQNTGVLDPRMAVAIGLMMDIGEGQ